MMSEEQSIIENNLENMLAVQNVFDTLAKLQILHCSKETLLQYNVIKFWAHASLYGYQWSL